MTPSESRTDSDDIGWLRLAVELSYSCPRSDTAYSVGAVLVDSSGTEMARGYSRENDDRVHAEESALNKLGADDERLAGSTIYTSLEPCTTRGAMRRTCTERILAARIRRVVLAWREPSLFVPDAQGTERLRAAGVTVIELGELADAARRANAHLPMRD